jgi:hypothetical protein
MSSAGGGGPDDRGSSKQPNDRGRRRINESVDNNMRSRSRSRERDEVITPAQNNRGLFSYIFPLPFNLPGSGSRYSYPGMGAEGMGYGDLEFYENIGVEINENEKLVAQTIESEFEKVLHSKIHVTAPGVEGVAKSTEYPPTELGVAVVLFLIKNNKTHIHDLNQVDFDILFNEMKQSSYFGCFPPRTQDGTDRFEKYKSSFKFALGFQLTKRQLFTHMNNFFIEISQLYRDCEILSIQLKGKSANSTDTADVSFEILCEDGNVLNIALDIKKDEHARQSNL